MIFLFRIIRFSPLRSPISFNAIIKLAKTNAFDSLVNIYFIKVIKPFTVTNSSETSYTLGTQRTAVFLT